MAAVFPPPPPFFFFSVAELLQANTTELFQMVKGKIKPKPKSLPEHKAVGPLLREPINGDSRAQDPF